MRQRTLLKVLHKVLQRMYPKSVIEVFNDSYCTELTLDSGGDVFRIEITQIEQASYRKEPPDRQDVHTEHCDYEHCKYGSSDCPVFLGYKYPSFPKNEDGHVTQRPTKEEFEHRRKAKSHT